MPGAQWRQGDGWRFARLFVLALLLVGGGAAAFHLSTLLEQRTDGMTRYVRVDVWAVQQAEYELQQFRARFARHVAGEEDVTMATVHEALAGAQAAIPLLRRGLHYQDFRLMVDIDGSAETVLAGLAEVESALGAAESFRGDLATLRLVADALVDPTDGLRQLAVDLAHVRAALQDSDLANVRWLTGMNRWMVTGFFGVVVVFVGFLLSETRAAKKAERTAVANEARTRYIAEHDLLTGLANRMSFRHALEARVMAARVSGAGVALHILNLDGFKDINESFGHAFGDDLLVAVAERLSVTVGEADQLFRLGGNEFALIEETAQSRPDPEKTAESLLAASTDPFRVSGLMVHIAASIGLARFPEDAESEEILLKYADLALAEAKKDRGRVVAFDPEMMASLHDRKAIEEDLRQAMDAGELEIYLQPQVILEDQRCIGAEALVRWRHPKRSWVSPGTFIPVAEESGLILPLGRFVLEAACQAALEWHGNPDAVVAVNVSPSQFIHQDIVEEVRSVLDRTGLPARRLELEITEGMLMRDEQAAIVTLERLHELGVQLAIDDFGTGYSSLSYLKRFKVDKLKIDQSFVRDMDQDRDDQMIVSAVVELASSLGMKTIAEGIETNEQMGLLAQLGCQEGQGYLFGRPMPTTEFRDLFFSEQNNEEKTPWMLSAV